VNRRSVWGTGRSAHLCRPRSPRGRRMAPRRLQVSQRTSHRPLTAAPHALAPTHWQLATAPTPTRPYVRPQSGVVTLRRSCPSARCDTSSRAGVTPRPCWHRAGSRLGVARCRPHTPVSDCASGAGAPRKEVPRRDRCPGPVAGAEAPRPLRCDATPGPCSTHDQPMPHTHASSALKCCDSAAVVP
jgi:hypothetical protein